MGRGGNLDFAAAISYTYTRFKNKMVRMELTCCKSWGFDPKRETRQVMQSCMNGLVVEKVECHFQSSLFIDQFAWINQISQGSVDLIDWNKLIDVGTALHISLELQVPTRDVTNLGSLCSRLVMIDFSDGLALLELFLKLIWYREFHIEYWFGLV